MKKDLHALHVENWEKIVQDTVRYIQCIVNGIGGQDVGPRVLNQRYKYISLFKNEVKKKTYGNYKKLLQSIK